MLLSTTKPKRKNSILKNWIVFNPLGYCSRLGWNILGWHSRYFGLLIDEVPLSIEMFHVFVVREHEGRCIRIKCVQYCGFNIVIPVHSLLFSVCILNGSSLSVVPLCREFSWNFQYDVYVSILIHREDQQFKSRGNIQLFNPSPAHRPLTNLLNNLIPIGPPRNSWTQGSKFGRIRSNVSR